MSNTEVGSTSLFSPQKGQKVCIVCNDKIKKRDGSQEVCDVIGFKNLALSWSKLDIPKSITEYCYLDVHGRVIDFEKRGEKIEVHTKCRTRFRNYLSRYSELYTKEVPTKVVVVEWWKKMKIHVEKVR